ncbi:MAG: hypothetical protein AAFY36_01220 [Bacteroidota bacterium]
MGNSYIASLLGAVFFFWTSAGGCLYAQPERENYFPADGPAQVAQLDPGDVLLAKSILLTNRFDTANVSFSLSFDGKSWADFALGPRYSSFFNMKGEAGCVARLVTSYGPNQKIEKRYYLDRGHCYGIFWNAAAGCWDVEENRCRR